MFFLSLGPGLLAWCFERSHDPNSEFNASKTSKLHATKFDIVEVDPTFYRTSSKATVQGWKNKTPEGFVFATKIPQVITHQEVLVGCDAEFSLFIQTMELLDAKLGALLFQFVYFNKNCVSRRERFARATPSIPGQAAQRSQMPIEIRNKKWLVTQFIEIIARTRVGLSLIEQYWMPRPD